MKEELIKLPVLKGLVVFLLLGNIVPLEGQNSPYIDSSLLKKHLEILASDAMQGRETGTQGQKKAADYIRYNMRRNNLKAIDKDGDYYQEFVMSKVWWDSASLSVQDTLYEHLRDFVASPYPNSSISMNTDKIYFLGYGIDDNRYSDYRGADLEGESILIMQGEPMINDSTYLIGRSSEHSMWYGSLIQKLKVAGRKGVKTVFVITDDVNESVQKHRTAIFSRRMRLDSITETNPGIPAYVYVSDSIADIIIGNKMNRIENRLEDAVKDRKFRNVKLNNVNIGLELDKHIEYIHTENVVGVLEGKDNLNDGYIILSGHYDHLGVEGKSVFNGADDNGSGCATILSLIDKYALQVAQGNRPEKSIVFIFMTGEEKGLLGSRYYVNNPLLPLDYAYTDINIDMIGRKDKHHDTTDYIYVIGADRLSRSLDTLIRNVNDTTTQLNLDYRYNAADDPNRFYYRSDHYNFAKHGIPIVFFFSGVHEDYHMPTDTEDKILYPALTERARLIYRVSRACAERTQPFPVNKKKQK